MSEEKLRRQLLREESRATESAKQLATVKRAHESAKREVDRQKKLILRIGNENKRLNRELEDLKGYTKKLETKLASGKKGHFLAEQNASLKETNRNLKEQLEEKVDVISSQKASISKYVSEIEVLSRALELRAEDLGMTGDIKGGLLYETAQKKEEIKMLAADMGNLQARINELEEHNWNLSQDLEGRTAERDAALDRATELAVEVEEKSKALDTTKRTLSSTAAERDSALKCVEEQSEKITSLQRSLAEATLRQHELEKLLESSNSERTHVNEKIAQLSSVTGATHEALRNAKSEASKATQRAEMAEDALEEARKENASLREEVEYSTERSNSLQQRVDDLTSKLDRCYRDLSHKDDTIASLRSQLEAVLAEQATTSRSLGEERQRFQHSWKAREAEFNSIQEERDAAISRAADLTLELNQIKSEVEELRSTNSSLSKGKEVLQRTMLSHVGHLREQLTLEQESRVQLEAEIEKLRSRLTARR